MDNNLPNYGANTNSGVSWSGVRAYSVSAFFKSYQFAAYGEGLCILHVHIPFLDWIYISSYSKNSLTTAFLFGKQSKENRKSAQVQDVVLYK